MKIQAKKKKYKIDFSFDVESWQDESTDMWLVYCRRFDISAYGKTEESAKKMFLIQVKEFLLVTV